MGFQPVGDVDLIRHAYVLPGRQRVGVGGELLEHLRRLSSRRLLVGRWAAADWAIRFYRRHGFERVSTREKTALLKRYWTIPTRQVETSVVLANPPRSHLRRRLRSCFASATSASRSETRDPLRAEGAFDASERSTAELGDPGASQKSGGCKHQSSSHAAGGRAAGIGHERSCQRRRRRRRASGRSRPRRRYSSTPTAAVLTSTPS